MSNSRWADTWTPATGPTTPLGQSGSVWLFVGKVPPPTNAASAFEVAFVPSGAKECSADVRVVGGAASGRGIDRDRDAVARRGRVDRRQDLGVPAEAGRGLAGVEPGEDDRSGLGGGVIARLGDPLLGPGIATVDDQRHAGDHGDHRQDHQDQGLAGLPWSAIGDQHRTNSNWVGSTVWSRGDCHG